jgi:hypothetical protein
LNSKVKKSKIGTGFAFMNNGNKGPDKWRGPGVTRRPGRPTAPSTRPKRHRLLFSVGLVLVFIGVIVGVTLRFNSPVQPYVLSIAISESSDPHWPVSMWARQDSLRFVDAPDKVLPFQEQSVATLPNKLVEAAVDARIKKRPLLIHILGQVSLTSRGAELVASDSSTKEVERRLLPIREILETLHNQNLPCLLLLDLRTIDVPWLGGLGELDRDEVLNDLKQFYDLNENSGVVTLCFCHAGSPTTVPNELGCSVLALALHEALSGSANGWNARGVRDIRVTTDELNNYVSARIHQWNELFGLPQNVPISFGKKSFVVRTIKEEKASDSNESTDRLPYAETLKKAWQKREAALTGQINRLAPLAFRRWESALVRADQRWLGGAQQAPDSDRVWGDLAQEETRFNPLLAVKPPRDDFSLSRQRIDLTADQSKTLKPLDALFLTLSQSQDPKPDEWAGALANVVPLLDANKKPFAQKLQELVSGWTTIRPAQLKKIQNLLESAKNPDYPELHLLRYLASLDDLQMERWQAAFPALIRLEVAFERVVPEDPRALPFIIEQCRKTDGEFLAALQSIQNPDLIRDQRAQLAASFEPLMTRIGAIQEIGQAISAAYRERDGCMALLPHLAFYDPPQSIAAATLQRQWDLLVAQLEPLLRKLETKNPVDLAWAADLRGLSERVRQTRALLVETLLSSTKDAPSFILQATLPCPTLPLGIREERYQAKSGQILEWASQPLTANDFTSMSTSSPQSFRPAVDLSMHLHKAHRALDLLKLAKHPACASLSEALQEAQAQQNPQTWQKLRQKLGEIWTIPATQLELYQRVWYLPPFGEDADKDPIYQERLAAERQLIQWSADRYDQIAQGLEKINLNVARSYRDLAGKVRQPTP